MSMPTTLLLPLPNPTHCLSPLCSLVLIPSRQVPVAVVSAILSTAHLLIIFTGLNPQALDAILTLMPLDFFVESPALYMDPDNGGTLSPEAKEVHALANATIYNHTGVRMKPVERTNFYKKAANTGFVVIQVINSVIPVGS